MDKEESEEDLMTTNEEAKAYFIKCNEDLISVAKDENAYNFEKQQIEAVCLRRVFEANKLAIKALEQEPQFYPPCEDCNKKMDEIRRVYDKYKEQEPCGDNRNIEEIAEVMKCDADADTKCRMISNILNANPHYFKSQEQKYCDRNICINNEYNGISCDECEVINGQEPILDKIIAEIEQVAEEESKIDKKWAQGLKYTLKIIDKYRK